MSIEAMKQAHQIIWRYRHETPLGNQPHMIAHEADEMIERIDQALRQTIAEAEKQEPVKREPLTDDEIAELWLPIYASTPPSGIHEDGLMPWRLARAIESAHGIKE